MSTYVFPGQGSQKTGMGADLFDTVPEFRAAERPIDSILGYSIRQLCLENPGNRLSQTQFTQPALFVVNALHYYRSIAQGTRPAFVAGHSLGEYDALLAAGVLDLITGVQLVRKRGELMGRVANGGMLAVIGLRVAQITEILASNALGKLDIANYNAPLQTVLSGPTADITRATPLFERAGAQLAMPLAVSAAFHSRYMAEPAALFEHFLQGFSFDSPKVPVIANVTGQPYPVGDATRTTRDMLVRQFTQPVQWLNTVGYLLGRSAQPVTELGPGNVLTRLIAQIAQEPRG